MFLYTATIFLSAFLLFLVQPVVSKQILPWFGGSAAVWTTCLVFFQTALLAGYVYADVCVRRLAPRRLVMLQTVLLVASLAILPIVPDAHWKPAGDENPSWLILGLLAASIGLPYFLLSTTSPLVQTWLARANPGANPYRLFALSNLASMLALLGYPFLLEPWSPTRVQALGWSAGYALFVGLCVATAWTSLRGAKTPDLEVVGQREPGDTPDIDDAERPTLARQLLWCTLAATGSILLLAVTNQVTRNVAAVPLLWIAPLAIYLLSFILVFDAAGWYRRGLMLPLAAAGLVLMALPLQSIGVAHELAFEIGIFLAGLFVACMFAHGELARLKPAPRYLTRFYLMISLGGAAGSALVGIAAPLVLPAYFELPGGLILCALLLYWQVRTQTIAYRALAVATILVTVFCATMAVGSFFADTVTVARNFYGVLRVRQFGDDAEDRYRTLVDGTTLHGAQFLSPALRRRSTAYFTPTSGIGRLLTALNQKAAPLRVGVIGLGAGTLAAYGRRGDTYRFYEINPDVIRVADRDFTFLKDSPAAIETALGDARLTLEQEAPQQFDVLAVDAFSSDAIPVHLMTFEALALYRKHVRPGGTIAFHVSNRFLDLTPVVEALAVAHQLRSIAILDTGNEGLQARPSNWVLLADTPGALDDPDFAHAAQPVRARHSDRLWTDDFNNLVQVLK